jgi:hypothetical protein
VKFHPESRRGGIDESKHPRSFRMSRWAAFGLHGKLVIVSD